MHLPPAVFLQYGSSAGSVQKQPVTHSQTRAPSMHHKQTPTTDTQIPINPSYTTRIGLRHEQRSFIALISTTRLLTRTTRHSALIIATEQSTHISSQDYATHHYLNHHYTTAHSLLDAPPLRHLLITFAEFNLVVNHRFASVRTSHAPADPSAASESSSGAVGCASSTSTG